MVQLRSSLEFLERRRRQLMGQGNPVMGEGTPQTAPLPQTDVILWSELPK